MHTACNSMSLLWKHRYALKYKEKMFWNAGFTLCSSLPEECMIIEPSPGTAPSVDREGNAPQRIEEEQGEEEREREEREPSYHHIVASSLLHLSQVPHNNNNTNTNNRTRSPSGQEPVAMEMEADFTSAREEEEDEVTEVKEFRCDVPREDHPQYHPVNLHQQSEDEEEEKRRESEQRDVREEDEEEDEIREGEIGRAHV